MLAEAFGNADIKIMGGDGQFLDKFVQAASVGQAVEGFVGNSPAVQQLIAPYTSGERSLPGDVAGAVAGAAPGGEAMKSAAVVMVLSQLLERASSDEERSGIAALLAKAREMGLGS